MLLWIPGRWRSVRLRPRGQVRGRCGLGFVPPGSERFDLVIPAAAQAAREIQGLLRVLSAPWLLNQLASLRSEPMKRAGMSVRFTPDVPYHRELR